MSSTDKEQLLMVAGEPSGDRAAARVSQKIIEQRRCRIFGVGGDHMRRSGVELIGDIDGLTALGLSEGFERLGGWLKTWTAVREEVERVKPRAALLVDAPDVNLPLARILTGKGVRVVWYVGPQIWAWRSGRLGLLKERTDIVALILPFEKPLYDARGVSSVFVGHPILDEPASKSRDHSRNLLGIAQDESLVAFLPGSRPGEAERHSKQMISSAHRLKRNGVKTVFAPGPNAINESISAAALARKISLPPPGCSARDILAASDAAIVASGTATLEAAVLGVPLAAVYVLDRLSWAAGRLFVNIPYVSLPNWVAGRKIVPELLQNELTTDSVTKTALTLLDPAEQKRQKRELAEVARALGGRGAAERVAKLVLERLG